MDRKCTVLVVDDEPINIKVMVALLKNDYHLVTAVDGFDAITKLKEHGADLIILDVMMPGMSGFETCSAIKSDPQFEDIPIIFLTASHDEKQGLQRGGIDYLLKPVDLDMMKIRVNNHIELKKKNDLIKEQRDLLSRQKEELEAALARIKRLEGIIPICMHCKSIRSDENSWQKIEGYLSMHTDALFSHGICPECLQEHYQWLKPDVASGTE